MKTSWSGTAVGMGRGSDSPKHYRVEVQTHGCERCSAGTTWALVEDVSGEPVEIGGVSYGDKETADDICDMLNEAFERGKELAL